VSTPLVTAFGASAALNGRFQEKQTLPNAAAMGRK
jgi:hypothetical protein